MDIYLKMETYLGDGLYAAYDGYMVRLYASNGMQVTNEVWLEPEVLESFKIFMKKIEKGAPCNPSSRKPFVFLLV